MLIFDLAMNQDASLIKPKCRFDGGLINKVVHLVYNVYKSLSYSYITVGVGIYMSLR